MTLRIHVDRYVALKGTDQNAAIHLYTHERACPEARSARGRGVSNNARARQRPWISAVSARADTLLAAGYRPIATGDLREVARIIGTKRPRLVLLDLMLPRPMVPTRVLGGVRSVSGRPQVGHPGAT